MMDAAIQNMLLVSHAVSPPNFDAARQKTTALLPADFKTLRTSSARGLVQAAGAQTNHPWAW